MNLFKSFPVNTLFWAYIIVQSFFFNSGRQLYIDLKS